MKGRLQARCDQTPTSGFYSQVSMNAVGVCARKTRSGIKPGILICVIIISVLALNLAHILRTILESQLLRDGI